MNWKVTLIPTSEFSFCGDFKEESFDTIPVTPKDGIISVKYRFFGEQEWVLSVTNDEWESRGSKPRNFRVYSLSEDMYGLNPYTGDLHTHSNGSDGWDDPAVVAANYRKAGFDFMALTDHHKREPSERMIDAYAGVPLGIKLYHGEEVHADPGQIHVVNFGGGYSVNEKLKEGGDALRERLRRMATGLDLPAGVNPMEAALRIWMADEIRKAGGISILAHPFWVYKLTYHMNLATLNYCVDNRIFDALELFGGINQRENSLQLSYYMEKISTGKKPPIVASSDSHQTDPAEHFGTSKTMIFAKDCELDSIKEAISNYRTVAIYQLHGESPILIGDFRMVKYARFLIDTYLPLHDELCVEEGVLMREHLMGDPTAASALGAIADRTKKATRHILRGE